MSFRRSHAESRPLRLLYLINGLGPGGAERSLAELLPSYLRGGIRPSIVCLKHRDIGVESAIRKLGCDVRLLKSRGVAGRVLELREILGTEQFDLIHTTLFQADVAGRLAAIGSGVPVLTSLVNTSYDRVRLEDPNVGRAGFWTTKQIDGWTARSFTTWFHAITGAVKSASVRDLGIPSERVTVVPRGRSRERLGFPAAERRLSARDRLGLEDDAEVVVNVARQEYQKGQSHLLRAMEMAARKRPRVVLLVSGREGHATPELVRLRSDLGLQDRVRFLGDRDDVPDILAAADVFAFPSVYEGLGGAVIEAMALGLPIVCSDIPALREVVERERNAFLVPPGCPHPFARALERILENREMARAFGSRSSEIFEERFTIERSAAGMIDLYERVAGSFDRRTHLRAAASVR